MNFKPNLFLLGAAKCGTTTLHAYLNDLSDVCMSSPKEPFFFELEYEKGTDFYREKYFSHWNSEIIIGESRHRNLYLPYIPERLHTFNKKAKLLVIIRDPIERAFSHWNHHYTRRVETVSFHKAIKEDISRINKGLVMKTDAEIQQYKASFEKEKGSKVKGGGIYRSYVDTGFYDEQISRYLQYFEKSSIKIIRFKDLKEEPRNVVESIIKFLELESSKNKFSNEIWKNQAKVTFKYKKGSLSYYLNRFKEKIWKNESYEERRKKELTPEVISELKEIFDKRNEDLSKNFNLDLNHWT